MAFSDEYDFRNTSSGSKTKPTAQSFLQNKLYDQMKSQGNFDRTENTPAPAVPTSPANTSNMIDSQIYKQFGEQNYNTSKQKMNTMDRGRQAAAAADENVNSVNMFKGLRQSVTDQADYYGAQATQRSAALFGDTWNVQNPPKWNTPGSPS